MNISHEVQVDLFPRFAWLHQKDGIMFTVGIMSTTISTAISVDVAVDS